MNQQFPLTPDSPPIASPDDNRKHITSKKSAGLAIIFGHMVSFGFIGQILFTLLELDILEHTNFKSPANFSLEEHLLLLLSIPLICATGGFVMARWKPLNALGHPLFLVVMVLAIGALAVFDLYQWSSTWLADFGG